jgi:integrase/recombinase XerD
MHEYLEWKKSYTKKTTYPNYERWIKRFTEYVGKEENFELEDVSRFRTFLWDTNKYAPKNVQYGLYLVRDYIHYLVDTKGQKFPLSLFKIKQERSNSHLPAFHDEYNQMISFIPPNTPQNLQRRVLLGILYDTGIRGGELLAIKFKDLDARGCTIRNEKNHRNRMVVWSRETNELLNKYLPLRQEIKNDSEYVFVRLGYESKKRLTTRTLERIVEELRKKAGIEKPIRPHSFRHGFVHRKLDEKVPITTIAQMLGHSSSMNVMNYAQLTGREIKEAWGV